jgi:hypothetical protein
MPHARLSLCLVALVLSGSEMLYGQEPFSIPTVDAPKMKVIDYRTTFFGQQTEKAAPGGDESNLSTFSKGSLGILSNGDDFGGSITPNISLDIIQYRLGIYSYESRPAEAGRVAEITRVYLPLMLLSKFSVKYDSTRLTTFDDVTSYAGGPFTIRLMPAYSFPIGLDNTFSIGHISDLRAITYREQTGDKLKTQLGYYCSFGVKYAGRGEVRDESGQSYQGRWSISLLGSAFFTNSTTKAILLNNPNDVVGGLEIVFKFIVSETKLTKFNIYASLQRQLANTKLSSPWTFKFTLGN